MDWIEAGITIIIAAQGANTLFLWSLHEKIIRIETLYEAIHDKVDAMQKIQDACGYCQKRMITAVRAG